MINDLASLAKQTLADRDIGESKAMGVPLVLVTAGA